MMFELLWLKSLPGGVSVDQIMSACHWKSHNTFTHFYLKDIAWADKDFLYLGPVVAAQKCIPGDTTSGLLP